MSVHCAATSAASLPWKQKFRRPPPFPVLPVPLQRRLLFHPVRRSLPPPHSLLSLARGNSFPVKRRRDSRVPTQLTAEIAPVTSLAHPATLSVTDLLPSVAPPPPVTQHSSFFFFFFLSCWTTLDVFQSRARENRKWIWNGIASRPVPDSRYAILGTVA